MSWTNASFVDTAVSVSSQGSYAWAVTAGGDLYQYMDGFWNIADTTSTSPIVSVSASIDGSTLAVNSNNEVFQFSYGFWGQLYSLNAKNASVGDVDNYVVVYPNNQVSMFNYGGETPLSSGPTKISSTAGLTEMWGVNETTGTVYRWNGASWGPVSGKVLKQIDVSYSLSGVLQVVGVDSAGAGFRFSNNLWISIPAVSGNTFTSLEAGQGYLWATTASGHVYTRAF